MNETSKDILSAVIVLALVAYPMAKLVNLSTELMRVL